MSAYVELARGEIGPAAVQLLYDAFSAVGTLNGFPPPEGHDAWTAEAVQEASHDYLAGSGIRSIRQLAVQASDDRSLRSLLERSVRNHLSSLGRTTVKGRLSRAVSRRLEAMESVSKLGGSGSTALWLHRDGRADAAAPAFDDLVAAAYEAEVQSTVRVVPPSGRGESMIQPKDLESVLLAVMQRAGCPADTGTLVDVLVARFPILEDARSFHLGDTDVADQTDDGAPVEPLTADHVWAQLTHNEQMVLGVLDASIRDIADQTGLKRSTAQRAVVRTRAILTEKIAEPERLADALPELIERSAALRTEQVGTIGNGLASSPDGGGDH